MVTKDRKEGGGAGGEYLSTSTVRAMRRTLRPNCMMTSICQNTNGGKEEKTGGVRIRRKRSRRLGRFSP